MAHLTTAENEVMEQGKHLKERIKAHAQQIIDRVQRSCTHLTQQIDTIVQQKTHTLMEQKLQAKTLQNQLKTCEEMIESSLNEWNEQQILTEKYTLMDNINAATHNVDTSVFQPRAIADMKFTSNNITKEEIGLITNTTYSKATLRVSPCVAKEPSTATLTLQSHDGSPLSLPLSLISSTLSSPAVSDKCSTTTKCNITRTHKGTYSITFTPLTRRDQLIVQVGGVDVANSPYSLSVIPTPDMRGEPVNIITGLDIPCGIAVCDNGDIVVAESHAHCITILNKEGKRMKSFEGKFNFPNGVAMSNDGHFLVTDDHRLQKLTTDGVCVKSVGSNMKGWGRLEFSYSYGIVVHPTTGEIFVADSINKRIQVFTSDLVYSRTISNWRCSHPYGLALDSNGNLYVTDYDHYCIHKFTTAGKYNTQFGSKGSAPGQLRYPTYLTVSNNILYVSDIGNGRVTIYDTNGRYLHCIGNGILDRPYGIAIDTLGNLYVCDYDNNRIVVF